MYRDAGWASICPTADSACVHVICWAYLYQGDRESWGGLKSHPLAQLSSLLIQTQREKKDTGERRVLELAAKHGSTQARNALVVTVEDGSVKTHGCFWEGASLFQNYSWSMFYCCCFGQISLTPPSKEASPWTNQGSSLQCHLVNMQEYSHTGSTVHSVFWYDTALSKLLKSTWQQAHNNNVNM